jgi:hypothetical protein
MKKNFKIGMGLAMVSIVSMAAVIPVFADVKPSYIEKTGTVIAIDAENTASGTAAGETANETANETGNKTVSGTDHSKSPNLCKLHWDGKAMAEKEPEVKPSDYKDEAIRKLAEEYAKKGYFLSDCKFVATHYSSGIGRRVVCPILEHTDSCVYLVKETGSTVRYSAIGINCPIA